MQNPSNTVFTSKDKKGKKHFFVYPVSLWHLGILSTQKKSISIFKRRGGNNTGFLLIVVLLPQRPSQKFLFPALGWLWVEAATEGRHLPLNRGSAGTELLIASQTFTCPSPLLTNRNFRYVTLEIPKLPPVILFACQCMMGKKKTPSPVEVGPAAKQNYRVLNLQRRKRHRRRSTALKSNNTGVLK